MAARTPKRWDILIQQAREGSTDALGKLFETFRPYLLSVANSELAPELRAKGGGSDLVQETFINAHQGLRDFRGTTQEEMLAWLRQILLNRVANFHRHFTAVAKRQIGRELPLDQAARKGLTDQLTSSAGLPERELQKREEFRRLEIAMARLPADYRQIVVWRNLERRTLREIAEQLGLTEKAAHARWVQAINALQNLLDEQAA